MEREVIVLSDDDDTDLDKERVGSDAQGQVEAEAEPTESKSMVKMEEEEEAEPAVDENGFPKCLHPYRAFLRSPKIGLWTFELLKEKLKPEAVSNWVRWNRGVRGEERQ